MLVPLLPLMKCCFIQLYGISLVTFWTLIDQQGSSIIPLFLSLSPPPLTPSSLSILYTLIVTTCNIHSPPEPDNMTKKLRSLNPKSSLCGPPFSLHPSSTLLLQPPATYIISPPESDPPKLKSQETRVHCVAKSSQLITKPQGRMFRYQLCKYGCSIHTYQQKIEY